MRAFAKRRTAELARLDLSGYVLKKGSPSCGLERVHVYDASGAARRDGTGLFAAALCAAFPHLPIEEEGRLHDPVLRESWIERVFAWSRLRALFASRWTRGDLVAFHTAHKLQLMAHSPQDCAKLGRLVADAKTLPRDELRARYQDGFMGALEVRATPRRNANAMQHMLGFFREQLDAAAKQELLGLLEDYRRGLVPLVVPLTLIRHYVRRFDVAWLRGQHYLEPHPKELMLRNHV
jgi:uncharacterized protein YbgA (DUF1722 family)